MAEVTTARYRKGEIDGYTDPLLWAIDHFRRNEHQFKPGGSGWLEVEQLVKELRLGFLYPHLEDGLTLDEWAARRVKWAHEGNEWAELILLELAAALIEHGKPIPESMRPFTAKHLRDRNERQPRRRGRKPSDLTFRDFTIATAIGMIALQWKLRPTRNEASSRPSAASIVKDALARGANLHLTEPAINKIWSSSGLHDGWKQFGQLSNTTSRN
jgi:hypothetical protein